MSDKVPGGVVKMTMTGTMTMTTELIEDTVN